MRTKGTLSQLLLLTLSFTFASIVVGVSAAEQPVVQEPVLEAATAQTKIPEAIPNDLTVRPAPKKETPVVKAPDPTPVRRAPSSPAYAAPSGGGVTRWTDLCRKWFVTDHAVKDALYVIKGESGGVPTRVNSIGCTGLFQIHPCHATKFAEIMRRYGLPNDMKNGESNIAFAAYMSQKGTNWSAWSVRPPGH